MNTVDAPQAAPFTAFADLVGRRPSIVMWYQSWSEPLFWSSQPAMVAAEQATPLITWDPVVDGAGVPLSQIAAGDYDSYLVAQARAAASWGRVIYVRFAHEMNVGPLYGPGPDGNTAAGFVAAWRHVVTVFRSEGATNVRWVWSPNVNCGGRCPFDAFYPGDSWVDWVALDGYNYSSVDDVPWMSFQQVFQESYDGLTALTAKPVMICETASAEAGGDKAQWITQSLTQTLPDVMPRVRAVVWFDRVKETDWRVNSSQSSLDAFRQAVEGQLFSGRLP